MSRKLAILITVVLSSTALAQGAGAADQKQCADQFKAADINNDGVLSSTEIGNAKQTLPASLANKKRVTRKEFMSVCAKTAS
jgi:hypothetical protein